METAYGNSINIWENIIEVIGQDGFLMLSIGIVLFATSLAASWYFLEKYALDKANFHRQAVLIVFRKRELAKKSYEDTYSDVHSIARFMLFIFAIILMLLGITFLSLWLNYTQDISWWSLLR